MQWRHEVPDALAAEIAADFGSASAWRHEFVGTAQSLAGSSGWVLLTYSRRQKRFWNWELLVLRRDADAGVAH